MFIALDKIFQVLDNYNTNPDKTNTNGLLLGNPEGVGFSLASEPPLIKDENPDVLHNNLQLCNADIQEIQRMTHLDIAEESFRNVSTVPALKVTQEKQMRVDNVVSELQENICWTDNKEGDGIDFESKSTLCDILDSGINQGNKSVRGIVTKKCKTIATRNLPQGQRQCVPCKIFFHGSMEYFKHYRQVHQVKSCSQCRKVLKGSAEMKRHLKNHKIPKRQHQCRPCKLFFPGRDEYNKHWSKEHQSRACSQCSKVLKGSTEMKRHLEHRETECQREATVKDVKQKFIKQKFICTFCGHNYSDQRRLNLHLYEKHDYVEKGLQACKICKLTFTFKKSFLKHMKQHETGLKCKHCSETFSDENSLRNHNQKHYSKILRSCPECSFTCNYDTEFKVSFTTAARQCKCVMSHLD